MKKAALLMMLCVLFLMPNLAFAEKRFIPLFPNGISAFYSGIAQIAKSEGIFISPLEPLNAYYTFDYGESWRHNTFPPNKTPFLQANIRAYLLHADYCEDSIWIRMDGNPSDALKHGSRLTALCLKQCGMSETEILHLGQAINEYLNEKVLSRSGKFGKNFQAWSDASRCFYKVEVVGDWTEFFTLNFTVTAFVKK